jgi:DNA-binding IclR family transcriptional regulator
MSTLSKTLALLDFFGPNSLQVTMETFVKRTGLSKATVYRHVRDLCDAGLLTRVASGSYSLGPRIIELDWMMRQYDPILIAGRELIHELAQETRLAVFSSVLYDGRIINTYIAEPSETFAFNFGRGQPLPLFCGAQSKVLVAYQTGRRLRKLFQEKIVGNPDNPFHDWSWRDFSRAAKKIRKDGYCITNDELTEGLTGIAAPILQPDGKEAAASLCVVGNNDKFNLLRRESVVERVVEAARRIAANLGKRPTVSDLRSQSHKGKQARMRRARNRSQRSPK